MTPELQQALGEWRAGGGELPWLTEKHIRQELGGVPLRLDKGWIPMRVFTLDGYSVDVTEKTRKQLASLIKLARRVKREGKEKRFARGYRNMDWRRVSGILPDGRVWIGCQRIPLSELEYIAGELGVGIPEEKSVPTVSREQWAGYMEEARAQMDAERTAVCPIAEALKENGR